MPLPEDGPDSTLQKAVFGYRATLLSQAVRVACKLGGVMILARLVTPAQHGLFAMAATFTLLLVLFRDLGMGAAAVRAASLSEGQHSALFWLHIYLGVGLAMVVVFSAPVVARFYDEPGVHSVLLLLGVGFILNGVNGWPRARLLRDLRFVDHNRIETAGAVAGTVAMIVAAAAAEEARSFAWFTVISETVMLIGVWRAGPVLPRAPAAWREMLVLSRTGLHVTGFQFLQYATTQLDLVLMGRWFGATALGFYNRAGQVLVQPATHIAAPFTQVLMPTLARLGPASPEFARHFCETTRVIAYLSLPVAALGWAVPEEMVIVLLGRDWPEAAPLLRWLAITAATSYLSASLYALCVAAGHAYRLTLMTAITIPVMLLGMWIGRSSGPTGLAFSVAMANVVMLLPRLAWSAQGTPVKTGDFKEALIGPVTLAVFLTAGLWAGRSLAHEASTVPRLIAAITGGIVVCAGLLAWPRLRRELALVCHHLPWSAKKAGQ